MIAKTLATLYAEHSGKVSDRWSGYFTEYDRILAPYRSTAVRLLEIGIQNGGSLTIWSQYFPHARKLVGCDINPDCARLTYDDPRIAVVVGDAVSDSTHATILTHASAFDVIMDDGSHHSSDVVRSFARYFPCLTDDGVFIVEDLHCSYWETFQGGLYHPFSSISFFKVLADVISHEHWGIHKQRTDILSGFLAKYDCQIDEDTLQHVHSVEFLNSMCVIRKATPDRNRLGTRVLVGSVGEVVPGDVLRSSREEVPDQTSNEWTARSAPPGEEVVLRVKELADRDAQLLLLRQALTERDTQIAALSRVVLAYRASLSGRLRHALAAIGRQIERIKRGGTLAVRLLCNPDDLRMLFSATRRIYEREGFAGLERRLTALQSGRHPAQVARSGDFSAESLEAIAAFANVLSRLKQWWIANGMRAELAARALALFRGETRASRRLARGPLRIHIDTPQLELINIAKDAYRISGWAVDLDAQSAARVRLVVGQTLRDADPKQREDVRRAFATVCELPLDTGFAFVLTLPLGVYRMRIEVEGVDGSWIPIRRALLVRVPGRSGVPQTPPGLSYRAWTRVEQKRLKAQLPDIRRHIEAMADRPTFTVVVDTRQGVTGLKDTIQSIRGQLYPFWDVRVLPGMSASPLPDVTPLKDTTLSDISGRFIVFMQSRQRLARNALYEFAAAINQCPDVDLVYGDEDSVAPSGSRGNPFHKPSWTPDYLETFNYIGFPACFRAAIARGCFDNGHVYDMVLRFTERTARILHVPKVLGHRMETCGADEAIMADAAALDIKALSERVRRTGRRGSVYEHELHKGCYGVRLDLKRSPLVSVIIPTAGRTVTVGDRRIDLIQNVIGQIRERSTYTNVEIIVVDNGDLSPAQLNGLEDTGCKRITYAEPIFNVSKKLNLGASLATGEFFLLMNDDIEIITPEWIERLLEHFEKPHVGVVGAKLLYPNHTTQHVGVVHNFGNPDHVRQHFPRDDAGYFFSTCGVRNYAAVTGACMMTPARVYREVGGYSHELAVSFNDVDFCMKVRRRGLWVVYTPNAELIHMESLSHVVSLDMTELAWFHQRWASELVLDQFYNERFLSVEPPTFVPCVNRRMA